MNKPKYRKREERCPYCGYKSKHHTFYSKKLHVSTMQFSTCLVDQVREIAKRRGVSMAQIADEIAVNYLENNEANN